MSVAISKSHVNARSIRTTVVSEERTKTQRFQRLDKEHMQALDTVFREYEILQGRMEVHLPYHKAKKAFGQDSLWVWPKFDKRPATYLIFMDGFPPCIWDPTRQEGLTLRWLLPPNFCERGPIVCIANMLPGEGVIQIEDLLVLEERELWAIMPFSERWEKLRQLWRRIPSDQPLLALKPRIVRPLSLAEWREHYDASLSWIIQHDIPNQPRWFWWDVVTKKETAEYRAPTLSRKKEVTTLVCALCRPYTKLNLPDTYMLTSNEGAQVGIPSISTIDMSMALKKAVAEPSEGVPVEVAWCEEFEKYKIVQILPQNTPISAHSFFPFAK